MDLVPKLREAIDTVKTDDKRHGNSKQILVTEVDSEIYSAYVTGVAGRNGKKAWKFEDVPKLFGSLGEFAAFIGAATDTVTMALYRARREISSRRDRIAKIRGVSFGLADDLMND